MIKKLMTVLMMLLAINFIGVAAGVAWLFQSGHLDKERVTAVKDVLFPKDTTQPTTEPSIPAATTQPFINLDELLARHAGLRRGTSRDHPAGV